jgi:general secretion pathway protein A
MYKAFYKLDRNPFDITPDPSFLFPTRRHKEALAVLYYGIRSRKGFVVLTGEVGTGKTLLIRCLLDLLKNSEVSYAYLFNSLLSPLEFLQYIAADLGLESHAKSKSELLQDLSKYLIARHRKKLITVIVVDEAQHLSTEVLEEIRLLTNLETAQEKLLQILLVGQPELGDKLDSFDLRQLKQRVALRSQLAPFDAEETTCYIHRRLQLAGASFDPSDLFPVETTRRVYQYSRGIARLINTVCENALITSFARQLHVIGPEIIVEAAEDLRLGGSNPPLTLKPKGQGEVLQAVKDLLDLHDRLQALRLRSQAVEYGSLK